MQSGASMHLRGVVVINLAASLLSEHRRGRAHSDEHHGSVIMVRKQPAKSPLGDGADRPAMRPLARSRGSRVAVGYVLVVGIAIVMSASCGPVSKVPEGDPAENIRSLALGYCQAAAANRGIGPSGEEQLIKFLVQRNEIPEEEARKMLISPRDNEPYVIRWGLKPSGNMLEENAPPPPIIIYEKTGADGTRYVADGRMSILALTPEEFAEAVPEAG